MSLAPGEQRELAEIERQLGRSDPGFVAMFALLAGGRSEPRARRWRPQRRPALGGRARMIIAVAVSVALLAASIAVTVIATSRA